MEEPIVNAGHAQSLEEIEGSAREAVLRLAEARGDYAPDLAAAGSVFGASFDADLVGTTGTLNVDLDCANGVRLRFEGVHETLGVLGKIGGFAAGVLMVDPASLVGKEVSYAFAATPTFLFAAVNVTWTATGNMTGVGIGLTTIPPSIGTGKFTRRG